MKPDEKPPTPKAGLIDEAAPDTSGAIHPNNILKHMNVPAQFHQAFIGGVKSVMQFITNPTTHKYFLQGLTGPGPVAQKLAEGVEGMMLIIMHQAKGALPGEMYVPVGTYAISWVADYVRQAKLLPVTDKDVALALQMFIHSTFKSLKAAKDKGAPVDTPQASPGAAPAAGGPPGAGGPPQAPPGPQPGPAMPKMTAAPSQAPGSQPNMGPGAAPGPGSVPPPKMG
jgi:hypothetical protein